MRRFRRLNRLYAFVMGYFWKPCPVCGRMFGGHEHGGTLVDEFWATGHKGRLMCWRHPDDTWVLTRRGR